jgi:hypothetical protein
MANSLERDGIRLLQPDKKMIGHGWRVVKQRAFHSRQTSDWDDLILMVSKPGQTGVSFDPVCFKAKSSQEAGGRRQKAEGRRQKAKKCNPVDLICNFMGT